MDEDIYKQYLLTIFHNLTHKRAMDDPKYILQGFNASCGDNITVFIRTDNSGVIVDGSFSGTGCLLSQVSAELLLEQIQGKLMKDVIKLTPDDMIKLMGIHVNPTRMKCVELPLITVKKIVEKNG